MCIFLILLYLLDWYQSTICIWQSQRSVTGRILVVHPSQDLIDTVWRLPVILDRGRRFLDMFKTLRPSHFHVFCSHDHSRSINTNVRQSCALFLHFYHVYLWKRQKTFKDMHTSAATICCRTRFTKMLKDLSWTYFVNIAVPNHQDLSRARMRSTCDFTTWLVLHRSQHCRKPLCDRGFSIFVASVAK